MDLLGRDKKTSPTGGKKARREAEKVSKRIDLVGLEVARIAKSMIEIRERNEIAERIKRLVMEGH